MIKTILKFFIKKDTNRAFDKANNILDTSNEYIDEAAKYISQKSKLPKFLEKFVKQILLEALPQYLDNINIVKKIIHFMIKKYALEAFKQAENIYRRGNSDKCMEYAAKYASKKSGVPLIFKKTLKEVLEIEFKIHSEYINNMIIRKPIKL